MNDLNSQIFSKPSIGVAIPTMNRPGMLREAIRSALDQERPPDEIFVSDNSREPDRTLVSEFPNVSLRYHWHDKPPMHIEDHWTWALGQPQTDYVCWLEDDNLFRSDHLSRLAQAVDQYPQAPILGTLALVVRQREASAQGAIFAPVWTSDLLHPSIPVAIRRDWALASYLFGSPVASSAVMIKRKAYLDHPFTKCHCWMPLDRWLWAQFAALGDFIYIPQITVLYRLHGTNHASTIKRTSHIRESSLVFRLIIHKMQSLGIDPQKAVQELSASLSSAARDQHVLELLRSRQWEWTAKLLPEIYGGSLRAAVPRVVALGLGALLRKMMKE